MKKTCLAAVLASLLASSLYAQEPPKAPATQTTHSWLAPVVVGSYFTLTGADLSTTMYLIGSRQWREGNPVLAPLSGHPVVFGMVKIGPEVAAAYALVRLHKTHPRAAILVGLFGVGIETYAVVHNARLLPQGVW